MRTFLIAAIALLFSTTANAACFVGLSVGSTASTSKLDDGTMRLDVGSSALMVGPEVGCSLAFDKFNVGGIFRVDVQNAKAIVDGVDLKNSTRWMALGTLGYQLNASTNIYGLAGLAGTKWEVPSMASANTLGLVVGAGTALDIGMTNWSLVAEFNHIRYRSDDLAGTRITPTDNVLRLGLRYSFGQ